MTCRNWLTTKSYKFHLEICVIYKLSRHKVIHGKHIACKAISAIGECQNQLAIDQICTPRGGCGNLDGWISEGFASQFRSQDWIFPTSQFVKYSQVNRLQFENRNHRASAMSSNNKASHYQNLIESLPPIPWILDWRTKSFCYFGPQIEQLLGWPRESWRTAHDFAARIHPLDRERVLDLYLTHSLMASDFDTEYSAITITGKFVLIRDVVHVVRNVEGEIDSLIGLMIAAKMFKSRYSLPMR